MYGNSANFMKKGHFWFENKISIWYNGTNKADSDVEGRLSADVDGNGSKESFTVEFDNGEAKDFSPVAFVAAMKYVE